MSVDHNTCSKCEEHKNTVLWGQGEPLEIDDVPISMTEDYTSLCYPCIDSIKEELKQMRETFEKGGGI